MSKAVFGKPLEKLLESDRKLHPNLQVPYLVQESIRCITRSGIDNEGIFRISGNKEKVQYYQQLFDKGEEIDLIKDKALPFDVSSLLKQYLRELPDPVLTFNLYDKWLHMLEIQNREEQLSSISKLIESLPQANQSLLATIIPFFGRIAHNSFINKMDSANLSKTVGPNLLWKDGKADSIEYLVNSSKINDLVKILIEEYKYFFKNALDDNSKWATFDRKLFGHTKSIQCLANGFEDKNVWSCDSSGTIRIWDTINGTSIKELDSNQGRLFTMNRVGLKYIWACSQSYAKVWNSDSGECEREIPSFAYCAVEVNRGKQKNVWVGSESSILVFNSDFEVEKTIGVPGNVVMSMCVDPNGKFVWGSTTDRRIFINIWDSDTGEMIKEINVGHKRKVNAFSISKNRLMFSAGDDGAICVWNCENFELIKRLEGHQGAVYGVTSFGDYVWSCGWDTTIRIWDINTLECVSQMSDHHSDCVSGVQSVIITQKDGKKVCQAWTSSWDKSICTFDVSSIHNVIQNETIDNSNAFKVLEEKDSVEIKSQVIEDSHQTLEEFIQEDPIIQQLLTKKEELATRRKMLEERRLELDAKKKDLFKRRQELINSTQLLENEIASLSQ